MVFDRFYIRYQLWPKAKVRGKYYYWVIRYGGKKRIPKEVVFRAMAKSMERMNNNLDAAARISAESPDASEGELQKTLDALRRAEKLSEDIKNLK